MTEQEALELALSTWSDDIVPVVHIGGDAVHIPYVTTWEHEQDHPHVDSEHYSNLDHIGLLPKLIRRKYDSTIT